VYISSIEIKYSSINIRNMENIPPSGEAMLKKTKPLKMQLFGKSKIETSLNVELIPQENLWVEYEHAS